MYNELLPVKAQHLYCVPDDGVQVSLWSKETLAALSIMLIMTGFEKSLRVS